MDEGDGATSLVVNADEFGLSAEVSHGIVRAHREGIVSSTSLLGNCAALAAARDLLSAVPTLGVGFQLTLVRGRPVAEPGTIRSLIESDGSFPGRARDVFAAWLTGRLQPAEIEREFEAQVTRSLEAGLRPDHLNTQDHIGFIPPVGLALEAVARRHRIAGLRSAVEEPTLSWLTELPRGAMAAVLGGLAWLTRRRLGALRHGPKTWGYVESGQLDEVRILEIVGRMGPGSHELICHPGEADDRSAGLEALPTAGHRRTRELRALTSPIIRHALEQRRIRLCRWSELF
jgi:chitin disaccharide deacetylase